MEIIRDSHGHDAHNALSGVALDDLDNVVLVGENVISLVEGESNVGEVFNTFARLVYFDTSDKGVDKLGTANNKGGT